MTLVIDPKAGEVQTLWVPLEVRTLEEAVGCLGLREKIAYARRSEWVGRVTAKDRTQGSGAYSRVSGTIAVWMESHGLDAVVWTALPYRGPDGGATRPGFDRLLRHLESLEGEARVRAEEYIRRAPGSIRTAYRIQFEKRLGWAPISGRT